MNNRKTDAIARQLDSFARLLDEISQRLIPFSDCVDPRSFEQIRRGFKEQADDFFSEQRKFNLAVLGQVKAGKSSFLNMLLFDGEAVLPRAATPKTSALTRIEYSDRNVLTVEYMTPAEWVGLRHLAASALETPQVRAARETIALAAELGTPVERCLAAGREEIEFEDYAQLNEQLDNFVGESGMLTPMVKYVTLGLSLDCLKNLSVIDTPGLNDPIISRTERTRQFISRCDAAFFLSRGSYFLDRNDMLLLTSQLPQKGVGCLTLVASQYDSALMDTLADYNTLEEADLDTRTNLRRHAAQSVDEALRLMRRSGGPQHILQVIEQCRDPIFVSAVAESMARKEPEDYSPLEKLVRDQLSLHGPITKEQLAAIGSFDTVRRIFNGLIEEKEELLQRKAATFVVTAQSDLRSWLTTLRQKQLDRCTALQDSQKTLVDRQLELSRRINSLQGAISSAVDRYLAPMDRSISRTILQLNKMEEEWAEPPSRTQLEVQSRSKTVSVSKWNRPWTWGKHTQVFYSQETVDNVLDPKELRIYLSQFWAAAADLCSGAFQPLEDILPLTNALYRLAEDQFPSGSPMRQPERLQSLAKRTFAMLDLGSAPVAPDPASLLPARFSQPVRDELRQEELREATRAAMSQITEDLRLYLTRRSAALRDAALGSLEMLQTSLGEDMIRERDQLLEELTRSRRELTRRQEFMELLGWYL